MRLVIKDTIEPSFIIGKFTVITPSSDLMYKMAKRFASYKDYEDKEKRR